MSLLINTKNRIKDRLHELTQYNDTDKSSIERFRMMSSDDPFAVHQLRKTNESIKNRDIELETLQTRLTTLEEHGIDDVLTEEMEKNAKMAKELGNATILMKLDKKVKVTEEDKAMSKTYYQNERKGDKEGKKWVYKSAQNHFDKWKEQLPEWMTREIERMPCNMGYLWKDIYCWGKQAPRGNKSNLTYEIKEAKKGVTVITRWDKDFTTVYHKKGKGPETIVSTTPRKKKL